MKATTIAIVKKNNQVAIAGDGQVTLGNIVFKKNAKKIKKFEKYNILAGFAGTAADAFSLMDKFESKLEEFDGELKKSAVELAKEWRKDKALRILDAMLIVADINTILIVSGNGDVIEPDYDIAAIGSGGSYAYAAGLALLENTELEAKEIAKKSLEIAGNMCIYTNTNISVETI